jgi:purine-binding chemotaxis protein CheW
MPSEALPGAGVALLVCQVGSRLCGIPLEHVVETMRPLPVQRLAELPPFVDGLALIRGSPTPVLDARRLLGAAETPDACGRYVTLRLGGRSAALAVDAVLGVRKLESGQLEVLPPLLRAPGNELVATLGTLDSELLVVLERARLVPDSVWQAVDAQGRLN